MFPNDRDYVATLFYLAANCYNLQYLLTNASQQDEEEKARRSSALQQLGTVSQLQELTNTIEVFFQDHDNITATFTKFMGLLPTYLKMFPDESLHEASAAAAPSRCVATPPGDTPRRR